MVAYAALWHLLGKIRFVGDRRGRQAHRGRALETRTGRLYFGFLLGLGVFTHMTTPFVYAELLVIAVGGPVLVAVAVGLGFAVGRSIPAVIGLGLRNRSLKPSDISCAVVIPTSADRVVGTATGVVAFALLAVMTMT